MPAKKAGRRRSPARRKAASGRTRDRKLHKPLKGKRKIYSGRKQKKRGPSGSYSQTHRTRGRTQAEMEQMFKQDW